MTTEAERAAARVDGADEYSRHLARQIVAMLPAEREKAYIVLSLVIRMLRLPVEPHARAPQSEPSSRRQ
jgi:hypothetical protein